MESLGVTGQPLLKLKHDFVGYSVWEKLPPQMRMHTVVGFKSDRYSMDRIWEVARIMEECSIDTKSRRQGMGADEE